MILQILLVAFALAAPSYKFEQLAKRDDVIWGFDFLADGRILFTERGGALGVYDPKSKAVTPVQGAPKVWVRGQGGLLDVRVHPTKKDRVFLTWSDPLVNGTAATSFGVGLLEGHELKQLKTLYTQHEPNSNPIHFGSRIEFDGHGHVFISLGERNQRERAQSLEYTQGKIIRLNEDGTVPKDNPFVGKKGARPEIWSYGHRNPQGLARNPVSGDLWEAEMGPQGGDEVNLIVRGRNYGWPVATYGREYSGPAIGVKTKPGIENPIAYWVPSISPSQLTVYNGDKFPQWKGNLFLANLSGMHLRRLVLDGHKITAQEELLTEIGTRFRCVRPGPDGFLYLSTDDGKLARLVPQ